MTKSPPKVRFSNAPAGSRVAAVMYQQLKPLIDKFYIKAVQQAETSGNPFYAANQKGEGLGLRYIKSGTQDIVEIDVSAEQHAVFEEKAKKACWDWVLLEVHLAEDPYAGAVEFYAQRTIPAPVETGVDDSGKVYDPSNTAAEAVDGLNPPATSYPGPLNTPALVEYTNDTGRRVSSLAIDLRRFGGGGTSVKLYTRVPPGTRYQRVLSGWQHAREADGLGLPTISISFDYFGDIETIGIATSSGGAWVTPPSAILPNGSSATYVSYDQTPGTQGDESFENSVAVEDAPAAPATIYNSSYFADAEAAGIGAILFGNYEVINITYHSPSGLVETLESTTARWTGYIPNIGGHRVEQRRTIVRWGINETYTNEPYSVPVTIAAEVKIVAGFGDLPFTAVKVLTDDGTTAGADHTRWAIVDDIVRFANTHKAADVTLSTNDDWTLVGTLTISPCQQAVGFSPA